MELIQGKHENILAVGQTERENGALLTKISCCNSIRMYLMALARLMENTTWI